MLHLLPIVAAALAAPTVVAKGGGKKCPTRIAWTDCDPADTLAFNTTLPHQCGVVEVPLDYGAPPNSSTTTTIPLEIVRIPASVQPSKGSILHNFGGPGSEARAALFTQAPVLSAYSGGQFDLLAFDPRGAYGKTIPWICAQDAYQHNSLVAEGGRAGDWAADIALGRLWAYSAANANICLANEKTNATGQYIGTAATARDLMSVVDALGEDGMLRFMGFSYGTTLGVTAAAMFPDRIDKMFLDGIQNPHEYYNEFGEYEQWSDADETFTLMIESCVEAGPELCPLAAVQGNAATAATLEELVWEFLEEVKQNPIVLGTNVYDYSILYGRLGELTRSVFGWPEALAGLAILIGGEKENLPEGLAAFMGPLFPDAEEEGGEEEEEEEEEEPTEEELQLALGSDILSMIGIQCGDQRVRAETLEDLEPHLERLFNSSRLQGAARAGRMTQCARWPFQAVEVYAGSFEVTTKNPVLFGGAKYDAWTSIRSAHNISATFEGSGVLEVDGIGHCTANVPSACAVREISAYFLEGKMPREGMVCQGDAPPFSGVTWLDVLEEMAGDDGDDSSS